MTTWIVRCARDEELRCDMPVSVVSAKSHPGVIMRASQRFKMLVTFEQIEIGMEFTTWGRTLPKRIS